MAESIVLTEKGKEFIRSKCSGSGNSLLYGKSAYKEKDTKSKYYNPDGVLPFCDPPTSPTKMWLASPKYGSKTITTNSEFGEALIQWYDKYAKLYFLDANVLAAQAFQESGYKAWNYPLSSTASGLCQFLNDSVFDWVIDKSKYTSVTPKFTDDEIAKITKNIVGNKTNFKETYSVGSLQGKQNRPILFQNIIDNPEIMIKAQCRYMRYIANRCDSLTSSVLFGYSRGPGNATKSYAESIAKAKVYTTKGDYHEEGVDYVYKIFKLLYNNFGYGFLEMAETPDPKFDKFIVSIG
jgi:hypothetical protein